ncbi:alpha/beta fold hydrolase [Ignatzschineria rhizosphaerae]|uniref:Alpha/beta fold hydrolase n=1 Tax=Ignatzschineria rhizosphaerae TaxID=2923279 RepID=A0ABY3WWN7_9GAMM|nr:alpha/beta fold hydrolase [Ignatzschineria rhizosphaerae]UNM95024.1 alpha/beta fold hydrolase [Ignatzschineria rhizosphaerae]
MSKILTGAEDFFFEGDQVGILAIHGFTGTTQSMRSLGQAFADAGYTVLGPRLTGHGISPEEMTKAEFKDWFQDVEEALDELRLHTDKIFITGLSMGGALTLYLAENYEDILGIMPINAAIDMPDFKEYYQAQKAANVEFVDGIGSDIKKPDVTELAYPKTPVKSMKELLDLMKHVREDLPKVTCPTLIFSSTVDHVVPPENAKIIYEEISSSDKSIIKLPESYHVATLDNDADLIATESIKFIREILASEI